MATASVKTLPHVKTHFPLAAVLKYSPRPHAARDVKIPEKEGLTPYEPDGIILTIALKLARS